MRRTAHLVFRLMLSIMLSILVLQGCKSQSALAEALESIAEEKVGPAPVREYNKVRSYVLFKEKPDSVSYTEGPLNFAVYRLADNMLMTEGLFSRGYVKWLNDSIIEVQNIPEKVKLNQSLEVYKRQIYIEGPNH